MAPGSIEEERGNCFNYRPTEQPKTRRTPRFIQIQQTYNYGRIKGRATDYIQTQRLG